MRLGSLLPVAPLLLSGVLAQNDTFFNLTAIAVSANTSVLECWQLINPFVISDAPGTAGSATLQFGDLANATYTVLPPRFNGGLHRAPHMQYVVFTSGLANITLPYYPDIAVVHGGSKGIIFAADTTGDGHVTTYPGDKPTIALQIPVEGGVPPNHTVLYSGPCKARDIKVIGT